MGCASGSGFKTQRTGASKSVHTMPAGQILAQPVEEGFTHPVRRGAQIDIAWQGQLAALPLAANDANLT